MAVGTCELLLAVRSLVEDSSGRLNIIMPKLLIPVHEPRSVAGPLQETTRISSIYACRHDFTSLETHANVELANFRESRMLDIDTGHFLRQHSDGVVRVSADSVQIAESAEYLPGITFFTDNDRPDAVHESIVVEAVADDSPAVGIA